MAHVVIQHTNIAVLDFLKHCHYHLQHLYFSFLSSWFIATSITYFQKSKAFDRCKATDTSYLFSRSSNIATPRYRTSTMLKFLVRHASLWISRCHWWGTHLGLVLHKKRNLFVQHFYLLRKIIFQFKLLFEFLLAIIIFCAQLQWVGIPTSMTMPYLSRAAPDSQLHPLVSYPLSPD